MAAQYDDNALVAAAAQTVVRAIRADLKERCLKLIEKDLDAAIDGALKGLEVSLKTHIGMHDQARYFDVVVRRVATKEA